MLPERFYSTDDIEKHAAGKTHWFDAASKRFFNSRIGGNVYACANPYITLFVSSEKCWERFAAHKRYYTVRSYDCRTGDVDTIGEFQEYSYRSTAHNAAKKIAPTISPTLDEQQDYAIALNEKYDTEKRRAIHKGERKFYISEIGYILVYRPQDIEQIFYVTT